MLNFNFYSPTEFVFGRGVENEVGKYVCRYGGKKVLIVYGGGSAVRSGLLDRVKASLQAYGVEYVEMGGVMPNPTDTKVYEGIEICRKNHVDMLLPVGGGSVIDCAKAVAAGTIYDGDFWDFYEGKTIERALPVGVVLTIPAAGSEGSGNSVITKVSIQKKISIRAPHTLRPVFAIMNPELTFSLPPYQTACGAVDMMAHIQERYFNNTPETLVTDSLSEALLRDIIALTPRVLAKPDDYDARANLEWCGTLAHNGLCGTGVEEDWASHAIEHELSAIYGVAHGAGLAVIFPAWLTWMLTHNDSKLKQWAKNVWNADTPEEGIKRYKQFLHSIGMPTNMKELGIENPDVDLLSNRLHEHKGEKVGAYVKLGREDTREIYRIAATNTVSSR